jgi:lysozyme
MPDDIKKPMLVIIDKNEGKENYPYKDIFGNLTVGRGYNLSARGLPDKIIDELTDEDIDFAYSQLTNTFPWFIKQLLGRQFALIDLSYNLGWKKFLEFGSEFIIPAIPAGEYQIAHDHIMGSLYAKQLPARAKRNAMAILTGKYEVIQ